MFRIIQEYNLSEHKIYNALETGLFWKFLRDKTYVRFFFEKKKTASGLMIAKQKLTFLSCVNCRSLHKLTALAI